MEKSRQSAKKMRARKEDGKPCYSHPPSTPPVFAATQEACEVLERWTNMHMIKSGPLFLGGGERIGVDCYLKFRLIRNVTSRPPPLPLPLHEWHASQSVSKFSVNPLHFRLIKGTSLLYQIFSKKSYNFPEFYGRLFPTKIYAFCTPSPPALLTIR